MRVEVVELPERLGGDDRSGHLFVVVDVLRLCSTMVTAFANGCAAAIAVAEPPEAFALRRERPELLLAGERAGYMIEGFDFGNSPFEMTREAVGGRTLVVCSTNGTKAIVASEVGAETVGACFLNASAAARAARSRGRDVTILCSGKRGVASLEDEVCAGLLVEKLAGGAGAPPVALSAGAERARRTWAEHGNDLGGMLEACEHGRYLTQIGMGRDVAYCAQVDLFELVPRCVGGVIRCEEAPPG
jgi:2-phosphosulfolactate phosphatase